MKAGKWECLDCMGCVDDAITDVYVVYPVSDADDWVAVHKDRAGTRIWVFFRKNGEFSGDVIQLDTTDIEEAKATAIALYRMA